jgi:hypothetical protein
MEMVVVAGGVYDEKTKVGEYPCVDVRGDVARASAEGYPAEDESRAGEDAQAANLTGQVKSEGSPEPFWSHGRRGHPPGQRVELIEP